jgi:hypothetical protein
MNTPKMRVSPAFMNLPAPDIKPGPPQNVPSSHIFDHMGPPETQFLQPDLIMENFASEDWDIPAQSQLEASLMTSTETPGSSRTRPRRTNQPAARDPEPIVITKPNTPKKTKAPPKRKRPNRQVNIVCTGCHRGNSPSNNFIVLCDGCDAPWHQKCHSPNIGSEVIEVADMDWFCIKCNPNQKRQSKAQKTTKKPGRPKKIMSGQIGNQYSENDRRAYLTSLSHDALVQLLLKVSSDWPLVPIFPPNMQQMSSKSAPSAPATLGSLNFQSQASTFPQPTSQTSQAQAPASQTTPEALTRLTSQAFTRTPVRKSYAESSGSDLLTDDDSSYFQSRPQSPALFEPAQAESQHDTDYDSEDYRAYPEAGQGFQIPMSAKDLDIMAEEEDHPTFSHSIRGSKHQSGRTFETFGQRNNV